MQALFPSRRIFLSHLLDALDEETDAFEIVLRGFPNQTAFLLKQE